mmetsp:Transcript_13233/g.37357  ORF Transcript_13233/g.37357 Transcript_13233/m.37357 type:complete len:165 (+) Transcript_13233:273-767(+)
MRNPARGTVRAKAVIAGHSRQAVFDAIRNMDKWSSWNTTFSVTLADGASEVREGVGIAITSRWEDGSTDTSSEKICALQEGKYLAWRYSGMPWWLLSATHHVTFEDAADGVEVDSLEDFSGPLVLFLHALGKLPLVQAGFSKFLQELQQHLDGQLATPSRLGFR